MYRVTRVVKRDQEGTEKDGGGEKGAGAKGERKVAGREEYDDDNRVTELSWKHPPAAFFDPHSQQKSRRMIRKEEKDH